MQQHEWFPKSLCGSKEIRPQRSNKDKSCMILFAEVLAADCSEREQWVVPGDGW